MADSGYPTKEMTFKRHTTRLTFNHLNISTQSPNSNYKFWNMIFQQKYFNYWENRNQQISWVVQEGIQAINTPSDVQGTHESLLPQWKSNIIILRTMITLVQRLTQRNNRTHTAQPYLGSINELLFTTKVPIYHNKLRSQFLLGL